MKIRKAEEKDIPRIMELLGQVLQIHAEIRPDVFIPGTTKYTDSELKELLEQEDKPIYVAAGEDDVCMGYGKPARRNFDRCLTENSQLRSINCYEKI